MPLVLLALLACDATPPSPYVALEPRAALTRLSLDLRGVRPSEAELAAAEADPGAYDAFVDRWIEDDPRFHGRMRELFDRRVLTRPGDTYVALDEVGLGAIDPRAAARAIGEEPLRLLTYVLENDLPYATMVTAPHTVADPVVAAVWDLEREPGDGWQVARWRDGRPAAGVLSMSVLWQRYPSMGGNANRHRANAVSRVLLCDDYLTRPIVLDRAAVDLLTIDPENAIAVTPSCQSCHSTLDPLAGNLFGFFRDDGADDLEAMRGYAPENEHAWSEWSGRPPGYFGRPTSGIEELGEAISTDPRFHDCAVQTVWEGFGQAFATDDAWSELQALRDTYDEAGGRLAPVVKAVVRSEAYRAGEVANAALDARVATVRIVSPEQLASSIADLTGYRWSFDGQEGLLDPSSGLPVLAGGIDGRSVSLPSYAPSLGLALIQERLAQASARYVAEHDLAAGREDAAILLSYVTADMRPDTHAEAFDTQIRALYLRVVGEPLAADAAEPDALAVLWAELFAVDDSPVSAWAGVVSAILRDPRVLLY